MSRPKVGVGDDLVRLDDVLDDTTVGVSLVTGIDPAVVAIDVQCQGDVVVAFLDLASTIRLIDVLKGAVAGPSGQAPGVIARAEDASGGAGVIARPGEVIDEVIEALRVVQDVLRGVERSPGVYGWVADEGEHTEWVVYEVTTGIILRVDGGNRHVAVREAESAPQLVALPLDAAKVRANDFRHGRASRA